jgi:hypothetical protein
LPPQAVLADRPGSCLVSSALSFSGLERSPVLMPAWRDANPQGEKPQRTFRGACPWGPRLWDCEDSRLTKVGRLNIFSGSPRVPALDLKMGGSRASFSFNSEESAPEAYQHSKHQAARLRPSATAPLQTAPPPIVPCRDNRRAWRWRTCGPRRHYAHLGRHRDRQQLVDLCQLGRRRTGGRPNARNSCIIGRGKGIGKKAFCPKSVRTRPWEPWTAQPPKAAWPPFCARRGPATAYV